MYPIFLLLFALLPSTALTAQTLFNVRLGTFQHVKSEDFSEIQDLGFVSGSPREGNLTDVYIGNYTTEEKAEGVVDELKTKGFRNASVQQQLLAGSRSENFVQLALRGGSRALDWSKLQSAGQLYVEATDAVVKVLAGPYATDAEAARAQARIRASGYTDAFIRQVDAARLIAVGVFETGIKKPLIPIDLTSPSPEPVAKPVMAPPPTNPAPASPATSQPIGEEALASNAEAADQPAISRKPASLPEIDVKTKRHSAAELQRVLKEKGYYEGSIDGYYGNGTRTAYEYAWKGMPELQKYHLLAAASKMDGSTAENWPEMRVVAAIADELAAGLGNSDVNKKMRAGREELLTSDTPLDATAATSATRWEEKVWENLDKWATEDPLHARIMTALRVSYYQSQSRLEAMYLEEGLTAIQSRDAATAVLENLLRGPLDRFL